MANSAFFVVFCLGNPALPQTTSTNALLCTNSGKEKRGTVLSERIFFKIVPAYFFVLKKSLVFKFFVNLLYEVTKIVYFIGNEHMLIAHDSNRLRFS